MRVLVLEVGMLKTKTAFHLHSPVGSPRRLVLSTIGGVFSCKQRQKTSAQTGNR